MASGGKRKGAGRKPCSDKKQTTVLYIETSIINALGGLESTKELLYNFAKDKFHDLKIYNNDKCHS